MRKILQQDLILIFKFICLAVCGASLQALMSIGGLFFLQIPLALLTGAIVLSIIKNVYNLFKK